TSVANIYATEFSSDASLTITPSTTNYPSFGFDLSTALSSAAGQKIVGHRALAYGSANTLLSESSWKLFDFVLLDVSASGPIRLRNPVHVFVMTKPDQMTTGDPRLYGVVDGDFGGQSVRVQFTYTRDNSPYTGHVDLTEPGEFIYDPRKNDPELV